MQLRVFHQRHETERHQTHARTIAEFFRRAHLPCFNFNCGCPVVVDSLGLQHLLKQARAGRKIPVLGLSFLILQWALSKKSGSCAIFSHQRPRQSKHFPFLCVYVSKKVDADVNVDVDVDGGVVTERQRREKKTTRREWIDRCCVGACGQQFVLIW